MDCTNLKVGDKIAIVYNGIGGSSAHFGTVEKVNKSTLVVNGNKYYRNSGWRQGNTYSGGHLDTVENGEKTIAESKRQFKTRKIQRAIKELELESSPELVNELLSILDRYK